MIGLVVLCILLSAFFSGMEIAFVSASRFKMEVDRRGGSMAARVIGKFNDNPSRFISTMLVGNNLALVLYGILIAALLEPVIEAVIGPNDMGILVIQTIISTVIILVTAEFLPKALFRLDPNRMLSFFALPAQVFYTLLSPVVWFIHLISEKMIGSLLRIKTMEEEKAFGHRDLDHFVNEFSSDQITEEEDTEVKIFKNAMGFSEVKVRECMIPRTEIVAVDLDTDIEELLKLFIETGLSKILVYRENIDDLIGYVHSFEMFQKPKNLRSVIRPMSTVPETMRAKDLLTQFAQQQRSVAVILDEFGGTAGMVTVEDIVEEIFGEIEDEHDKDDIIEIQVSDNEFRFSSRIEIDLLNDKYGFNIPVSDEYETLAGFIISEHQSIPNEGEVIVIGDFSFTIVVMETTRIEEVKMKLLDT